MSQVRIAVARLGGLMLAWVAVLLTLPLGAASAGAATPPPTVMILLDTNESLVGAGIAAERQVALRYLSALPLQVRAGLITFNDGWRLLVRPTTDRVRLDSALAASKPAGFTSAGIGGALSGAKAAVDRLGAPARSRLLVLSDGEMIAAAIPVPALPTDVVTWRYESDDNVHAVRALAYASGGRVRGPAHIAALAAAFRAVARPAAVSPSRAPQRAAAHATSASSLARASWSLIAVLGVVFAAVFVVALLVIGSLSKDDRSRELDRQIGRYGPRHAPAQAGASDGKVAGAAIGLATQFLQSSNAERGLAERLDLAAIARKPAEWVLLCVCACAVLAAALTILTGTGLIGIPAGILAGWLGMRLAVSVRITRRRAAFSEQLPDVLQLIAGSLRSGFSLPQALDSVVREDRQPAAGEFSRALAETRIGVELEAALDGIASRMDSRDMRWTVMAIRIQREVGGNLAEVLGNTVDTMRERAYLHRHVRALSAEGRLSAYILIALPVAIGGWLFLTDPAYLRLLYTTVFGGLMLTGAGVLFVLGVLWMRVLIKVEV